MRAPFEDPPRTPHGVPAPTSQSSLRNAWTDIRHGAPRRVISDAVERFAATIEPTARVLEVGAGHYDHGRFFAALERLDSDPAQHPNHLGDAHHMPIGDGEIDAVLAVSVLEHVDNPYRVVREIARVLRPGGRAFVWVPFFFAVHAFPTDIARFTDIGLQRCVEQAGLVVDHADRSPYSGVFHNASNWVHFALPRSSPIKATRLANRVGVTACRALFALDTRWKTTTMYSGTELIARKPD